LLKYKIVKSRRKRLAEHIACLSSYRILVKKAEIKTTWEAWVKMDNIKINLKEKGYTGVDHFKNFCIVKDMYNNSDRMGTV
jgi:hypothetical protein